MNKKLFLSWIILEKIFKKVESTPSCFQKYTYNDAISDKQRLTTITSPTAHDSRHRCATCVYMCTWVEGGRHVTWGGKGTQRDEDARYVGENEREKEARGGDATARRKRRVGIERELTPPPRHQIAPHPLEEEPGRCCFATLLSPTRLAMNGRTRVGFGNEGREPAKRHGRTLRKARI